MKKGSRKKANWTIVTIALVLVGLVSIWTIFSRQANKDKSYTGAKFIEYEDGVWANGYD